MKKGFNPNPFIDPITAAIIIAVIALLIKGCLDLQVTGLPTNATGTVGTEDALITTTLQILTPNPTGTLYDNSLPTNTLAPLPAVTPTSILTGLVEDQLVGLIDRYYRCLNRARRDVEGDYQECWNLLSSYPGEIQDNQNKLRDGNKLESFSDFWNDLKVGYALYPCRKTINGVLAYFVDVEYVLYSWNDLSIPIDQGKKFYLEYSFGLDENGWRIKAADNKISGIGSYCLQQPSVEKWNPAP
jgi:hypothetical protein